MEIYKNGFFLSIYYRQACIIFKIYILIFLFLMLCVYYMMCSCYFLRCKTAGQDSRTAQQYRTAGQDSRTVGLWSKIGAEYKDAPKKLQQNTTTTVRSRNSMANGLVLKEKHIHSIDLNNIPMFFKFLCHLF